LNSGDDVRDADPTEVFDVVVVVVVAHRSR